MEIIDTTDWDDERMIEWAEKVFARTDEEARLKIGAVNDNLSDEPRTITIEYHGDSKEAALARGYKIRDQVEENTDLDASCELTGRKWVFEDIPDFYELAIHIEGGE